MRLRLESVWAALLLAAIVGGCASSDPILLVDLKTDFVPGRDFVGARTEVAPGVSQFSASDIRTRIDTLATRGDDFIGGQRLAEISPIERGMSAVRVSLIDPDGEVLAQRVALVRIEGATQVTLLLTTSCLGVSCPGATDDANLTECLGGRCVDPRCSPQTPEFCGEPSCEADSECSSPVSCVDPTCLEGTCFGVETDTLCEAGFTCVAREGGCMPEDAQDAGPADAGPPPVDGGPGCPEFETSCDDGVDEDCDGLMDCEDPDCLDQSCDDGTVCTDADVCGADGTCGGAAIDCDDGNECTDDACDPTDGCMHTDNAASCDDGFWCNGPDTCAAGACTEHGAAPCPSFCNEMGMACEECAGAADCGSVSYGSWSACNFGASTCAETGTQSRSVMTPQCSAGTCTVATSSESRSCTRDTDGTSCGSVTYGSWGSCGYSSTCDESATQSRSVMTPRCSAGSCSTATTSESRACTRDTDGTTCGSTTYTSWGACNYSDACDQSANQTRTRTDRRCGTGSCRSSNTTESRGCSRSVADGTSCGGMWNRCCSGVCRSLTTNDRCSSCRVSCSAIGLTCASTGTGGYACRGCSSNAQCRGELDSRATCYNVSSPPAWCQCQCAATGVCADGGCGAGFFCHACPGTNFCSPVGGSC